MRFRALAVGLLVGGLFVSGAPAAQGAEETTYSISGKVKDQATGRPVSGIEVSAWAGSDNGGRDLTDARGRYEIEVPGASTYSMDFLDPDERYIGVDSFPGVKVDGDERYNMRLVRGGTIRGRVVGRAGPLENVTLDLYHRASGAWVKEVPYGVQTNAAGRISIPLRAPGTYRVGIDPYLAEGNNAPMFWGGTGTIRGSLRVKVRAGLTTRLGAARLRTGSTMYGTVTRPDGTPVLNARVDSLDLTAPVANPTWPRSYRGDVSTDAEGKFTMGSLAAHPYKVCAINNLVTGCLGGGSDPDESTTVRLSRGEVREVRLVVPWP